VRENEISLRKGSDATAHLGGNTGPVVSFLSTGVRKNPGVPSES